MISLFSQHLTCKGGGFDRMNIIMEVMLIGQVILVCGIMHGNALNSHDIKCHPSFFQCNNSRCVKADVRCNLVDDCGDNSDERGCKTLRPAPVRCKDDEYLCQSPAMCVHIDDLCSDFNECLDFDQIDQICPVTCQPHKFKCLNASQCVSKKYLCDGKKDCMDESDELYCDDEIYKCREEADSFLCDDHSACIHADLACDDHVMCDDGSDEKNDCYKLCQDKCGENQLCVPEGRGVKCVCEDGYRLGEDGETCVDKEYCAVSDLDRPCSQECHEGHFGAHCRCIQGYTLDKDGHSCKAVGSEGVLYMSTATEIYQRSMDSDSSIRKVIGNLSGVTALAFDADDRRIFWSEIRTGQSEVIAMSVDGGERTKEVVASFGLQQPSSLAYDYITKNLYIVDTGLPAIWACELQQKHCTTVYNHTVLRSPSDVVLHPAEGVLYYTETGADPAIMKGSMDGKSFDVLVSAFVQHPVSLVLDLPTNRLYWIDLFYDRVFHVDLDGTNKRRIHGYKIVSPAIISIFEDQIFWTSGKSNDVMTANKFTAEEPSSLIKGVDKPTAILIEHKSLQNRRAVNRCQSKRCHLCLLNDRATGSCFCSRGYDVDFTEQYCEKVEAHSFLLASDERRIVRVDLDGTSRLAPSFINTTSTNMYSLAYQAKSHEVFYSDMDSSRNGKAVISKLQGLDGTPRSVVVVKDIVSIQSIAVDGASSLVFWTDIITRSINVASLDGKFQTRLPINVTRPYGLTIDSIQGLLYYSQLQSATSLAAIRRCRLDGLSCSTLVSDRLHHPTYLLAKGQQLYWSDYGLGEISAIDQWGNDRVKLVYTNGKPLSFAIDQNILYWTEENRKSIFFKHIHKNGGFEGEIETGVNQLTGLIAAAPYSLPQSACSFRNGDCDQICISIKRSTEASCLCSRGYHLDADGKRCVGSSGIKCEGFLCGGENRCLGKDHKCDGVVDCEDSSDEVDCPIHSGTRTCSSLDFQCDSGQCVAKEFTCDWYSDCKDGSDEKPEKCSFECESDHLSCDDDTNCVPHIFICDKEKDCTDGTDERNCPYEVCAEDEFSCGVNHCIPEDWKCDGWDDCDDGADEVGCPVKRCLQHQFKCVDGECIDRSELCDGLENCFEGEDEENCPEPEKCSDDEFRCYNGECIHKSAECDGIPDCDSREDEKLSICNNKCSSNEFQCQDGACIPMAKRCDGNQDCNDASDEGSFCPRIPVTVPEEECEGFTCAMGQCVAASIRCDGKHDCRDSSDEANCNKTCKFGVNQCSQICRDTLSGIVCQCEPGFRMMSDGLTCEDIDECQSQNGGCSQTCVNLKGASRSGTGFKCHCLEGYARGKDYFSCKARKDKASIYVGTLKSIKKISMEGSLRQETVVIQTTPIVMGIDMDIKRGALFWNHYKLGQENFLMKKEENKAPRVIHAGLVVAIAVDWVTGNVYMIEDENRHFKISVLSSDGHKSSLASAGSLSRRLVLHPMKGVMFWVNNRPALVKASMDGSGQSVMKEASRNLDSGHEVIMSLDHATGRLYWLSSIFGQVKSVTVDDQNVLTFDLPTNAHQFLSMDVFESIIYFLGESSIMSFPAFTDGTAGGITLVKRISYPIDIKIHHPLRQPYVRNKCASKNCMYICVLTSSGFGARCMCPDGYKNESNPRCEGPKVRVPTSVAEGSGVQSPVSPASPPTHRPQNTRRPAFNATTPTTKATTRASTYQKHQDKSLAFSPACVLYCYNGGQCLVIGGIQSCWCPADFDGPQCRDRREVRRPKQEAEEEESLIWLVGLVLGLAALLMALIAAVWYFRCRRHNQSVFSSIRFQKQQKFVVCHNKDDRNELVPEISFGNPGFQDEIDEEADMHADQEWWKKLISRSRRSVDSAFHSIKNSNADDSMDGYMRAGDPQDAGISDKIRLLK